MLIASVLNSEIDTLRCSVLSLRNDYKTVMLFQGQCLWWFKCLIRKSKWSKKRTLIFTWNSNVHDTCINLFVDSYYCFEIIILIIWIENYDLLIIAPIEDWLIDYFIILCYFLIGSIEKPFDYINDWLMIDPIKDLFIIL